MIDNDMQELDFTEGLNDSQKEAVLCSGGPMLIVAGAGSGKTRVLTLRIAHLMSQGVKPYNILALTFTNKAAREMKERIANIVGEELAYQLWMGTFHSIFAKILRREAATLGITPNFSIYDSQDSLSLIKKIIKEMNLNDKEYAPSVIHGMISRAKNDLILPQAFAPFCVKRPYAANIYARYMEECRKAGALDFDDLLLYTDILFKQDEEVLAKYQNRFQHILVDEYQDTNMSQYSIIRRLAGVSHNICVVGDDAQSIYSFRGARIQNILTFQKDYPETRTFKLEQNYRSTQNIVGAANMLISHNMKRLPKTVFSKGAAGDKVKVMCSSSDLDEAAFVVADIRSRMRREDKSHSDFAILYRTNSQSRVFEDKMRKMGLPYRVYGGLSFYQRKEIKDVLAYMRLVINHNDIASLRRVINYPKRQIGDTSVEKIETYAAKNGLTVWSVISNTAHLASTGLNGPTQGRVYAFASLIETLSVQMENFDAYHLTIEALSQSGLLQELGSQRDDDDGKERYDNVQELLNGLKDFVDTETENAEGTGDTGIAAYLQEISLATDLDISDDTDHVTMMTIHSSKGLEFDTVYIVGVEEEIFPGAQSMDSLDSVEEERRLMYVALTRAKNNAVVSYARQRMRYGKSEQTRPSRFVKELDPQYCCQPDKETEHSAFASTVPEWGRRANPWRQNNAMRYSTQRDTFNHSRPAQDSFRTPTPKPSIPPSFTHIERKTDSERDAEPTRTQTSDGEYSVGMAIIHERFGRGVIKEITDSANDTKLMIEFDTHGTKTLLLKFARIEKA